MQALNPCPPPPRPHLTSHYVSSAQGKPGLLLLVRPEFGLQQVLLLHEALEFLPELRFSCWSWSTWRCRTCWAQLALLCGHLHLPWLPAPPAHPCRRRGAPHKVGWRPAPSPRSCGAVSAAHPPSPTAASQLPPWMATESLEMGAHKPLSLLAWASLLHDRRKTGPSGSSCCCLRGQCPVCDVVELSPQTDFWQAPLGGQWVSWRCCWYCGWAGWTWSSGQSRTMPRSTGWASAPAPWACPGCPGCS